MRIQHDCGFPPWALPPTVSHIRRRWRCPICGDIWRVELSAGPSMALERLPIPTLKHAIWLRKLRKIVDTVHAIKQLNDE